MFKFKKKDNPNIEKNKVENTLFKQKEKRSGKKNKEFAVVTYCFLGLFLCLIGYFVYFNFFVSEDVINSSYNSRQDSFADRVVRGSILAEDGQVLAYTETDSEGTEERNYPFGDVFCHVVGYSTKGKSGIESFGNFSLLRSHSFFLKNIVNEVLGKKNTGDSIVSTLNVELQQTAYNALGDYNGAIVVMEPDTGKILAMVSKPDYDPNQIDEIWDSLVSEDAEETADSSENDSVLLNRATQGLYPPGSIFKIFTTLEYFRENTSYSDYEYNCTGSITVEGSTINCYKGSVHGQEDLITAFAKSCNCAYSDIGLTLNLKKYKKLCESSLFNEEIDFDLPTSESSFTLDSDADAAEIMQTVIGQGETQVTPLQMAMVTSAIANGGTVMKPYLIDHTQNENGVVVKQYKTKEYKELFSEEESEALNTFMEAVADTGTASALNNSEYEVAGKTGSAEYGTVKGQSHAWFVGYSSTNENADIAVAVIVEGAGAGSAYAVPMAKEIFDAYYN